MKFLSQIFILCFLALSSILISTAHGHTLLIESSGNKVKYTLNSVEIPLRKLMNVADEMVAKGQQNPLAIIFDSAIPLDVVLNAQGILNKAGFRKITYFARWKESGTMCEVSLGMSVPFTLNPSS